ncbi:hypothetical protein HY413_01390 [Candidatus Kaiserbacteria bacterium]|nr:hypothetical protein [Candidatus Kaiserbacteria bacterium]
MTTTRYIPHLILLGGVLTAVSIITGFMFAAHAQENTITFPVAELGNCTDKASCKAYCNDSEHITECIAFAEAHGLMKKEEAVVAKKFAQTIKTQGGPGGCTDPQSCKAYCENIEHIDECISFAEASGHTDPDVAEGKKVAAFIKSGGSMPGGCTSRQRCEAYCSDFEHSDECLAFAEEAGLEIREPDGRKVDIAQIKKIHALMKSGETPGGCTSRDQCEAFCENPDNAEQCLTFAERAGFMPHEEIARARKMMQEGGPGGCRGRVACEAYCTNPENQEACMAFAEENGMMRSEDAQRMREMRATFEQGVQQEGPKGRGAGIGNCVREKITGIMSSGGVPNQGIMQEAVQACMSQTGDPGQLGDSEGFGGEGFDGMGSEQGRMMGRPFEGEGEFHNQFQQQLGQRDSDSSEGASSFPARPQDGKGMPFNPEDAKKFMNEDEMRNARGMMESGIMPKSIHGGQGEEGALNAEFQRQFEGEYQRQYQQQYEQQYKGVMQGNMPQGMIPGMRPGMESGMQGQMQPGMMPPNGGTGGMTMPAQGGGSMPPSGGSMMGPSSGGDGGGSVPPPPTQSIAPMNRMVAGVFQAVLALYGFK